MPRSKKKTMLKQLEIERIDFVDRGAHQNAHVMLTKRSAEADKEVAAMADTVNIGELEVSVTGLDKAQVEELQDKIAKGLVDAKAEADKTADAYVQKQVAEAVAKREEELRAEFEKGKSEDTDTSDTEEEVVKSLPDEAKAIIEKAQADAEAAKAKNEELAEDVSKMREEQAAMVEKAALVEYTADVEKRYGSLPLNMADLAKALRKVTQDLPEEGKVIEQALAAGNEAFNKSKLFGEMGVNGTHQGSAVQELEKRAQAKVESKEAPDIYTAKVQVQLEDEDLTQRVREETTPERSAV